MKTTPTPTQRITGLAFHTVHRNCNGRLVRGVALAARLAWTFGVEAQRLEAFRFVASDKDGERLEGRYRILGPGRYFFRDLRGR